MNDIAKILLEIQAVKINVDNFFSWTSGIRSPVYCDNRQIISYPIYRKRIINQFVKEIQQNFSDTQLIAGTATAGIPWAAWIAERLELPMIYIRSSAKQHGLKNNIEGKIQKGINTLIIEDLISTGNSALLAAKAIQDVGLNNLGVISIFNYELDISKQHFSKSFIPYFSLCGLEEMLQYALKEKLLTQSQIDIITKWKQTITN